MVTASYSVKDLLSDEVTRFLESDQLGMLIGGEFVDAVSGSTLVVEDPASGARVCEVPAGQKKDIDRAVSAASAAFKSGPWSHASAASRSRTLNEVADLIEAHADAFAELDSLDSGKPVTAASASTFLRLSNGSAISPAGQRRLRATPSRCRPPDDSSTPFASQSASSGRSSLGTSR